MEAFVLALSFSFFFFNDTATTEIYTLSLHDALPISRRRGLRWATAATTSSELVNPFTLFPMFGTWIADELRAFQHRLGRSEEHTSELQSRQYLVCRLLLEKKKRIRPTVSTCNLSLPL